MAELPLSIYYNSRTMFQMRFYIRHRWWPLFVAFPLRTFVILWPPSYSLSYHSISFPISFSSTQFSILNPQEIVVLWLEKRLSSSKITNLNRKPFAFPTLFRDKMNTVGKSWRLYWRKILYSIFSFLQRERERKGERKRER